jgi:hypothetical protein
VTHGHAIGRHQRHYSYQITPARNGLIYDTAECTHPIFGKCFPLSCAHVRDKFCVLCVSSLVAGPCARLSEGLLTIFRIPRWKPSACRTPANMITFKDTHLALIHIPLHLYSSFLQSILQLLLPNASRHACTSNGNGAVQPHKGWPYEHPFVNISITPIECSIVCSRVLADELFVPVLGLLDAHSRSQVHITSDDFVVMQIDGEGLDAGQRVLELTSPLALAGM